MLQEHPTLPEKIILREVCQSIVLNLKTEALYLLKQIFPKSSDQKLKTQILSINASLECSVN